MKEQIEYAKQLFNQKRLEESLAILNALPQIQGETVGEEKILRAAIYVRLEQIDKGLSLIKEIENEIGEETPITCNIKAIAFRTKKNNQKALEILQSGFEKFQNSIDLAHNLSVTAADLGRFDLAEKAGLQALALNSKHIETYKNLGRIYVTQRDTNKALKIFRQLNKIQPQSIDALVGMGAVELLNSQPKKAMPHFEKALSKNENLNAAWANLGICKKYLGDYEGAKHCLEMARLKDPNQVEHTWNLALINLAMGNFEEGWAQYEIRYSPNRIALDAVKQPITKIPMLTTQDSVVGKVIILVQEQGYGDTLQFFRLSKLLKEEGAKKIIAMVARELKDIVKTIPWIDEIGTQIQNQEIQPDYWVFSMSLPNRYQFRTPNDLPDIKNYLSVDAQRAYKWKRYLSEQLGDNKIRVGLVWAGRESHSNDANRSITYEMLEPLLKLCDSVQYIALQKGNREQDCINDPRVLSCGHLLESFADTAALLSNIDLLISIDSSPVHLAGGLGMPVWTLIPAFYDFRWLIDRQDSPWYPSMRLFRQKNEELWPNVIKKVEQQLKLFIQDSKKRWESDKVYIHPELTETQYAGIGLFLNCAFKYQLEKRLEVAEFMYIKSLRVAPNSLDGIRNLAALYRAQGRLDDSENLYKAGEKIGIKDEIFYMNYANLLIQLKKYNEAKEKVKLAIAINPSSETAKQIMMQCQHFLSENTNSN